MQTVARDSRCDTSKASGAYLPIAVKTLRCGKSCTFDLFQRNPNGMVLYRHRDLPLYPQDIEALAQRGINTLFVSHDDRERYSDYLETHFFRNEQFSLGERYCQLREATRHIFEDAMRSQDNMRIVRSTNRIATQMTEVLCDREFMLRDMLALMIHDYSTFTHAMNVMTFCLAIAQKLGVGKTDLVAIASGALLHDIGKRNISSLILNKRGPLSLKEKKLITGHPQLGFEALCLQPAMHWGTLMMIYQHHERLDGSGYPANLVQNDIHDWAKICAAADVFDALLSKRSYHKPTSGKESLSHLEQLAGTQFDKEIVRCLQAVASNA